MGAVAFVIIMLIIFFAALFGIFINILFIIIYKLFMLNGKSPKKLFLNIPIIFLVFNILLVSLPIGYVLQTRHENIRSAKNVIRASSGRVLYWGKARYDDNNHTIDNFEIDGKTYIDLYIPSYMDLNDKCKLGEPFANIMPKPPDAGLNKFFDTLLAYEDISTLYPIINSGGFELYTLGHNIFCPENKQSSVISYYRDFSNYDTINCESTSFVYEKNGTEIKDISKNVTLDKDIFEKLYAIKNSQNIETIIIPDKYSKTASLNAQNTPIYGFEERNISVYSNDNVMKRTVTLALIDNNIYFETYMDNNTISGYRLPTELCAYFMKSVF